MQSRKVAFRNTSRRLHEAHQESYGLIRRTVQQVAPFFDDFRLQPLQLKRDDIKL
jgi:hypothetical protein